MKTYEVDVCRIAYGNLTIEVQASSSEEAMRIAEEEAGNYSFNEHTSEYKSQGALQKGTWHE